MITSQRPQRSTGDNDLTNTLLFVKKIKKKLYPLLFSSNKNCLTCILHNKKQWVKSPPVTSACHPAVLFESQVLFFRFRFLPVCLGRQWKMAWEPGALPPTGKTRMVLLEPGFSLASLWLLQPVGKWTSGKLFPSLQVSLPFKELFKRKEKSQFNMPFLY